VRSASARARFALPAAPALPSRDRSSDEHSLTVAERGLRNPRRPRLRPVPSSCDTAVLRHAGGDDDFYVEPLQDLAALAHPWRPVDWKRLLNSADAYGHLLFERLREEEDLLFAMARQLLPEGTQLAIEGESRAFDRAHQADTLTLRRLAETLVTQHCDGHR